MFYTISKDCPHLKIKMNANYKKKKLYFKESHTDYYTVWIADDVNDTEFT